MNKKKIYTLSYSNILTPPPYLYQLEILLHFEGNGVHIKYNKHFLDREDFSSEELEDEGLTPNDDIHIDVTLSMPWASYFKQLTEHANWSSHKPSENMGYLLSLKNSDEQALQYLTLNKIEYQLEEVYQAFLETEKIEAPLSLQLKKIHNGSEKTIELVWHFKDRLFEVITNQKKSIKSWDEGQNWLSQFYEIDLSELTVHKKKLPEGKTCINPGDGLWYEAPNNPAWQKILNTLFSD